MHEVRTWIAAFSALSVLGAYTAHQAYYKSINERAADYGGLS